MRKIFAQICANLPENNSKEKDFQKKTTVFHWAQGTSSTIFAQILQKLVQIPPNLPENNKIKT